MIFVAMAALLLGGYRAASSRRQRFVLTAVNYEIDLQRLRLEFLTHEVRRRRAPEDPATALALDELRDHLRAMKIEPGEDPLADLRDWIDVHESIRASYDEASRSPMAWISLESVPRNCDCVFCDFIDRTMTTGSLPP
jgi:hypothetical protein